MARPDVPEDTIRQVENLTDEYFSVADSKISFAERVEKLAELYTKLNRQARRKDLEPPEQIELDEPWDELEQTL